MKTDAREAESLGEACDNGDGTYDGFRLLSWLSSCVTKEKGLSEDEIRRMWEELRSERKRT